MLRKSGTIGIVFALLTMAVVLRLAIGSSSTAMGLYDPSADMNASPDALRIASKVGEALCNGACGVALRRNPTIGSVQTFIAQNGSAKVVYNPRFLKFLDTTMGDGAIFGILACEVGRVIDPRMNVAWMPRSWVPELRADAWAGCAIARAALPKDKTIAAVRALLEYPSPSHSAANQRVPALELGYRSCGGSGKLPQQGMQ